MRRQNDEITGRTSISGRNADGPNGDWYVAMLRGLASRKLLHEGEPIVIRASGSVKGWWNIRPEVLRGQELFRQHYSLLKVGSDVPNAIVYDGNRTFFSLAGQPVSTVQMEELKDAHKRLSEKTVEYTETLCRMADIKISPPDVLVFDKRDDPRIKIAGTRITYNKRSIYVSIDAPNEVAGHETAHYAREMASAPGGRRDPMYISSVIAQGVRMNSLPGAMFFDKSFGEAAPMLFESHLRNGNPRSALFLDGMSEGLWRSRGPMVEKARQSMVLLYTLAKESPNTGSFYENIARSFRRGTSIYEIGAGLGRILLSINDMDLGATLKQLIRYDYGRLTERMRKSLLQDDGRMTKRAMGIA